MELSLSLFNMKLLTAFQTATIKDCAHATLGPGMIPHTLNIFSTYYGVRSPALTSLLREKGKNHIPNLSPKLTS